MAPENDLEHSFYSASLGLEQSFGAHEGAAVVTACGATHYFVAFSLRSEQGAVADSPYRIVLPDGEVRVGRLNGHGHARVENLPSSGDCRLTFPDIDLSFDDDLDSGIDPEKLPLDAVTYLPGHVASLPTCAPRIFVLPEWQIEAIDIVEEDLQDSAAAASAGR
jgi:hypothetical protein